MLLFKGVVVIVFIDHSLNNLNGTEIQLLQYYGLTVETEHLCFEMIQMY